MKRIKKLNMGKKLSAMLLAGSIAFTLSACSGNPNMKSLSPEELLSISDIKDLTLVDELMEEGLLPFVDGLDAVEAAEKLEDYMDTIEDLSKIDFTGVSVLEPLTKEQCAEALSLSEEDIETKKEQCKYRGKDVEKLEQRLTALKMLSYLKDNCLNWVHANGQKISFQYMMAAVKGAVADELDIPTEDYSSIRIAERTGSPTDYEATYRINVGEDSYRIKPSAGVLWDTVHYIYAVQEADLTEKTEFPTYRKALNYGKAIMAAGMNLKNDKLVAQNKGFYIKKNYVKH